MHVRKEILGGGTVHYAATVSVRKVKHILCVLPESANASHQSFRKQCAPF